MSCHGFVNYKRSTVMLLCRSKLVSYNLSKVFVIIENRSIDLRDVPLCVKQIIIAEILHKNYFSMECYRSIPYAGNTF